MKAQERKHTIFSPSEAHEELRETVGKFSRSVIDGQAREHDEKEKFNDELFRRLGKELGIFGVTVPEKDGGLGMDATAAVIIHEEMSKYDPGFTLSYLA
ncbi:MAG TPA: acyl-CoA dehydrogenase family protein, partial [Leptospiraceae bacterium]|nr:acyl-CoA dehydrogenase family protein [Leptospiraceae bacterium]